MKMGRIGRKFLYCRKALFWLPYCAAGAMALLLVANGVWVRAQATAPATQAARTQPSTPASPTDIVAQDRPTSPDRPAAGGEDFQGGRERFQW
jgi:hypothetical protein